MQKLYLPITFAIVHTVFVVLFALAIGPVQGPEADAGAMAWIFWIFADFPIGYIAFFAADSAETNIGAITIIAIGGAVQWGFWGFLLGGLIDWLRNRKNDRPQGICRKCKYDLRGTLAANLNRCPECGTKIQNEDSEPETNERNAEALEDLRQ